MCASEVFHFAHLNLFSLKTCLDVTTTELIKIQFLGQKLFSNVTLNNCKKKIETKGNFTHSYLTSVMMS